MIVVYAGLQRVASRAAAATLPQLVVAAGVVGRRGGHGNIFGGNLKSIDQSQQLKRKPGRVYGYLIIL